jgi:serine/threonine-protein kinase
VPPSERVGRHVPPDLEALVLACLAKDPDDRPASAEWLAERLAECQAAGGWTPARAKEWWEQNFNTAAAAPLRADAATSTNPTPLA